MNGRMLFEILSEAWRASKQEFKKIVEMIDWDTEYTDQAGINYMWSNGENDYILSVKWNGDIDFKALEWDDAVDCVREHNINIGSTQSVAMAS